MPNKKPTKTTSMPEKQPYRILLTGGGTGGHIYPAIAVARALEELYPGTELLFVGARGKMEMEKVPKAGYRIEGLEAAGLQRRLTVKNLLLPFKFFKSLLQARKVLKDFQADAVAGFGGYASAPLALEAKKLKLPLVLQEQNSYAGLTNRYLSRWARAVCTGYPDMEEVFPKAKVYYTGNPVRTDIRPGHTPREEACRAFGLDPQKPVVLSIGGSLGAQTLNESLLAGLVHFEKAGVQLLWQTGKLYWQRIEEKLKQRPAHGIFAQEFIYQMPQAYAAANLVISRAGALSVSELAMAEKPSILVPSPNVAADHQTKNASALFEKGAALQVQDEEARQKLVHQALNLVKDKEQQKTLSQNIKGFARPRAAHDIAEIIVTAIEKTTNTPKQNAS